MTESESKSPTNSVSSATSSPTSFHSHQDLETEATTESIKNTDAEVGQGKEGEEMGVELGGELDGQSSKDASESARTTLEDELQQSKADQIQTIAIEDEISEQKEESGENLSPHEGEESNDRTKNELVQEDDPSLTSSGLASGIAGEPLSDEPAASDNNGEVTPARDGEGGEAIATPATPNPNLGDTLGSKSQTTSTPNSNSVTNSPFNSNRSSPYKNKNQAGGKGGVAELLKKFQSKEEKNSPTASPARSASGSENAKIDLPNNSLVKEMDSVTLSEEKEKEAEASTPPSESSNATAKQQVASPADQPDRDSHRYSPSTSSHKRLESESLLNSSIPWASEISNSSSDKTIRDVIHSDEPNRFFDSTSQNGNDPTGMMGSEAGASFGNGERSSSTRFSTVSLSSNKILEDEISSGSSIGNKRNTITKSNNNRNSNSNYDFLLARLEKENGRLSRDPKANRSSIDGTEKLKNGFIKLKEEDQSNRHSRENSRESASRGSNLKEELINQDDPSRTESTDQTSSQENEEPEIDWDFWGSVMNNYQLIAQTKPLELSLAIQAGIPPALRGMMWQLMSSSKDEEMEIIYAYYLKQTSSHEKSIRRDLSRTFPDQDYFKDGKGVGQENLFNVIKAYSLYDEEVGYCQGMQFIVGPLLLNMPDEEAFSTLVRLMKSYDLRGHFTPNMPSLQLRLFQFDCLIEEFLPLLHKHLVRCGIKSSMYASQWFMTLFSYRFPLDFVYRVLDSVFAEGIEAVFRFALALMQKSEEILLNLNFEQAVEFLKMNLFDVYLQPEQETATTSSSSNPSTPTTTTTRKKRYDTNQFVKDAFSIQITAYQLDTYAAEFDQKVKAANAHRREVDALRLVNKNLSKRIKDLEAQLQGINDEHVDLINQVVRSKVENDEIANELVKYKILYAQAMENQ